MTVDEVADALAAGARLVDARDGDRVRRAPRRGVPERPARAVVRVVRGLAGAVRDAAGAVGPGRRRRSRRPACNWVASGGTRSSDTSAAASMRGPASGRATSSFPDGTGRPARRRARRRGRAGEILRRSAGHGVGRGATSRVRRARVRRRPARTPRRVRPWGAADGGAHCASGYRSSMARACSTAQASRCGSWRGRASRARSARCPRPAGAARLQRRLVATTHVADEPAQLEPHQDADHLGDR